MGTITLDDRLLAAYLFYGSILLMKAWVMSLWTSRHRLVNKVRPLEQVAHKSKLLLETPHHLEMPNYDETMRIFKFIKKLRSFVLVPLNLENDARCL